MNTEKLFEFQVLAQILHYGTAASRLHMSQSVLSRHIQSLENELGVQLFSRTSHKVALTSAGMAFYRLSKDYLKDVHQSADAARITAMGLSGSVKVGFMLPTMSARIRSFLRRFGEHYPDIYVSANVMTDLNAVNISDLNFITLASTAMATPGYFELAARFPEKGCLVFPENSPIKPGSEVSLKELANETLFLPGYNRSVGAFANAGKMARQATDDHIHIEHVSNPETAILNVELGKGFTILPKHRASYSAQEVRFAELKEECVFETILMHNRNFDSSADSVFEEEFIKIMQM